MLVLYNAGFQWVVGVLVLLNRATIFNNLAKWT